MVAINGSRSTGGEMTNEEEREIIDAGLAPLLLQNELFAAREDTERLDWLEQRRVALNRAYGTDYGWKLVLSHNVTRAFVASVNTIDLSDAEPRAGNIRDAIDAARKEGK